MITLGRGKALPELARMIERNTPEPPGETGLYLFGLKDTDRHSHLYISEQIPDSKKIADFLNTKGAIRVNVGLPVETTRQNAIGITEALRTPELLPVTANVLTWVWLAANKRAQFPRERVIRYVIQAGDIVHIGYNPENLAGVVAVQGDRVTVRLARRTEGRWEFRPTQQVVDLYGCMRPAPQEGDYVRLDIDRGDLLTDFVMHVQEIDPFGRYANVSYNGHVYTFPRNQLVVVRPPD